MQQGGSGAWFASGEKGLLDHFLGEAWTGFVIVEKCEPRRQQIVTDPGGRPLPGFVHVDVAELVDREGKALGEAVVTIVGQPGLSLCRGQQ